MLAIAKLKAEETTKCTPNVLPCKLHHNGPVSASERYWKPETVEEGQSTAYFRGRKLKGRRIKVPAGYEGGTGHAYNTMATDADNESIGVVLQKSNSVYNTKPPRSSIPQDDELDDGPDNEEDSEEARVHLRSSTFQELVVWGHEVAPEDSENPYVKGVEEWMAFAHAIHSYGPAADPA
ncbi:hypothetical protein LTR66_000740 [Elasticomyces elasticus]|nr:hypothetical protein LTR28_004610 [Elasticomyces elasticus]KAK5000383.1 hypothetical protein LTR66_000740 [Elasticomyces elasticus]